MYKAMPKRSLSPNPRPKLTSEVTEASDRLRNPSASANVAENEDGTLHKGFRARVPVRLRVQGSANNGSEVAAFILKEHLQNSHPEIKPHLCNYESTMCQ